MARFDASIMGTQAIEWNKCKGFWALKFGRGNEGSINLFFHFDSFQDGLSAGEMLDRLDAFSRELREHLNPPKKYYKVLSGGEKSPMAEGQAAVQYTTNGFVSAPEWLAKKGYHLLVYDNLEEARKWRRDSYTSIWEVEVKNVIENPVPRASLLQLKLGVIVPHRPAVAWPQGTIMVEEVKLIRQITSRGESG